MMINEVNQTQRTAVYDSTYTIPRVVKFIETVKWQLPGVWVVGKMGNVI